MDAHRAAVVELMADMEEVLVPIQYWNFWTATASDGARLTITPDKTYGVLSIAIPDQGTKGQRIQLHLPYHWSEKLGFLLSIAGVAIWLLVSWRDNVKKFLRP